MRSIWKGAIAFGLVNIPVKVYTATENHDIAFHQVHALDGGRINYQRVCRLCGNIVAYADIDKAYESADGTRVVLTDTDFAQLPAAEKHEIPVLQFVPAEQIDPLLFDKAYFLEPDSATPKAYVLLAQTLAAIDRLALVHFTLRQKTRLAALRVREDVVVLHTLLWPDEVRSASFPSLTDAPRPTDREKSIAETLVQTMSGDFDPADYTDDYQRQLRNLLEEALARGGETEKPATREPAERQATVVDLVSALQQSLAERQAG